ncbi:GNAT family N-acetyltransferase [Amycolatopsis sp. NPDC051061]|uniref:GNAT family N-acetyltransferase n=1 Tax=Amycolatopsis sp. NPDC051061 TaxID=3155042 RepID=UPI003433CF31
MSEPRLAAPGARYHASFLAALREFHDEGLHTELRPDVLADPEEFRRWTEAAETPTHREYWWVAGAHFLGRARLNLRLTGELPEFGGHIGYDIRPTARGRGHATALLRAVLSAARGAGIDCALLTCAPDNHASRRVIERNGGVFTDISSAGRLRFWCPTG